MEKRKKNYVKQKSRQSVTLGISEEQQFHEWWIRWKKIIFFAVAYNKGNGFYVMKRQNYDRKLQEFWFANNLQKSKRALRVWPWN